MFLQAAICLPTSVQKNEWLCLHGKASIFSNETAWSIQTAYNIVIIVYITAVLIGDKPNASTDFYYTEFCQVATILTPLFARFEEITQICTKIFTTRETKIAKFTVLFLFHNAFPHRVTHVWTAQNLNLLRYSGYFSHVSFSPFSER